mmetsp:Transcript_21570/g.59936  ORF Transcript_21570/g.59936 Transcript_21570/m.59936 type:complete len:284 (-) Transcript_21570:237-1088(-)
MGPEEGIEGLEQSQDHNDHAADAVAKVGLTVVQKDVEIGQRNDPARQCQEQANGLDNPVKSEPRSVEAVLEKFCHEGSRREQVSPPDQHERGVGKVRSAEGILTRSRIDGNGIQRRSAGTAAVAFGNVRQSKESLAGALGSLVGGRVLNGQNPNRGWNRVVVRVEIYDRGPGRHAKSPHVGVVVCVVGIASGARSDRLCQCHGLLLAVGIEPESTAVHPPLGGRIQQDLERRRDARFDVDQAVDGVLLGTLEGSHRGIVEQGSAIDAKGIHDVPLGTDGVACF